MCHPSVIFYRVHCKLGRFSAENMSWETWIEHHHYFNNCSCSKCNKFWSDAHLDKQPLHFCVQCSYNKTDPATCCAECFNEVQDKHAWSHVWWIVEEHTPANQLRERWETHSGSEISVQLLKNADQIGFTLFILLIIFSKRCPWSYKGIPS